ncbi:MAG: hypothetical protein JW863_06295 [Chitinispirillaceae bacterium]|nr:hypothetical protein [Chitinispirillaceae bacterium]
MKKIILLLIIVGTAVTVLAVGDAAVITLEFPFGSENCALGESGVSHAKNIQTVFWNPAGLPAVYDELQLNFLNGSFHEDLLPAFFIPDLYHESTTFGVFLNDVLPYTDISYAFFRNYISMGENIVVDSLGLDSDTVFSDETVLAHAFAFRLFDIVSLGVSLKSFDSRLAPGIGLPDYPGDGVAEGNAFDIGLRIGKRFSFLDLFEVEPAFGVSLLNWGPDSALYIHDSELGADPLPKRGIIGGSAHFNLLELFEYTIIYEEDYTLVTKHKEKTEHLGQRFQISPFYIVQRGHMYDGVGNRNEIEKGYTAMFNLQKTLQMVFRLVKLYDYLTEQHLWRSMKTIEDKLSIGGWKFKPNVHYSRSHSEIFPQNDNIAREGQVRDDRMFGLGIVATFPTAFGAQPKPDKKDDQLKPAPPDYETVELPEPLQQPVNKKKDERKSNKHIMSEEDGELVR